MLVKDLIAILSKCDREQHVCLETGSGNIYTIWGIAENDYRQVIIQGNLYIPAEDREGTLFSFDISEKSLMWRGDKAL